MPRVVAEVQTGIEPRVEGKDWSWEGWLPKGRIRHFLRLSRCPGSLPLYFYWLTRFIGSLPSYVSFIVILCESRPIKGHSCGSFVNQGRAL